MHVAYPHVAERLFGRPHAIEPGALRAIMDGPLAKRVLAGERVGGKQVKKNGRDFRRDRLAALSGVTLVRKAEGLIEYSLTDSGIAIVPIAGVLSRRFDWLAAACGWSTYEGLAATLQSALDDFGVRAIMLDVDTPGGEAAGMLDLADAIVAARDAKPIWAVANVCAASAGYALAGSATRLVLPRLAIVGSIGCMMVHVDQSVRDAAGGYAYTAIYSGARKMDGWAHAPLSQAALAAAQADVDHVRDEFAALIRRQGRISAKAALATEAAVFADENAVTAGLADAVMTFDEALAELTAQITETPMPSKAVLNSTVSPAATAVAAQPRVAQLQAGDQPAAPAAAATANRAAAAAHSHAAKSGDDMTPPEPGETCALCGQVMPDPEDDDGEAGDEPGDDEEQQTGKPKKKSAASVPAAAAPVASATAFAFTADDAADIAELCTIARLPQLAAGFIKAETPVKKVRAALAAKAAEAAGDELSAARPADPDADKKSGAMWDSVVASINAENARNTAARPRR